MAEQSVENKARALAGKRVTPENAISVRQEAQNQLLGINAERRQNLATQRAMSGAEAEGNANLATAAGLLAESSQAGQPMSVNPATQQILGQYGMKPSTIQKVSQRSSENLTKQNIVINNYTTTTTTTNNTVQGGGGPVQGRALTINPDAQANKTKAWLNGVFARQNEIAAKRDLEYQKRDAQLGRSSNKMLRKLEEATQNISQRLDPRNLGKSMKSTLKSVLMMLGFSLIAKHWPTILSTLANIEERALDLLAYFGVGPKAEKISGFKKDIIRLLGGDVEKDNGSILEALKGLVFGKDGEAGILKLVGDWIENKLKERTDAIKTLKAPEFSMLDIKGSIGALGEYLKDILACMLDPGGAGAALTKKTVKESVENNAEDEGKKEKRTKGQRDTDIGEAVMVQKGGPRGLLKEDLDNNGRLVNSTDATIRQGQELTQQLSSKSGEIQTAAILGGLSNLEHRVSKTGGALVGKEFIESMERGGVKDFSTKLGDPKKYKFIKVAKEESEQRDLVDTATPGIMDGLKMLTPSGMLKVGTDKLVSTVAEYVGKNNNTLKLVPIEAEGEAVPIKTDNGTQTEFEYYNLNRDAINYLKSELARITQKEDFSFNTGDLESLQALDTHLKRNREKQLAKTGYSTEGYDIHKDWNAFEQKAKSSDLDQLNSTLGVMQQQKEEREQNLQDEWEHSRVKKSKEEVQKTAHDVKETVTGTASSAWDETKNFVTGIWDFEAEPTHETQDSKASKGNISIDWSRIPKKIGEWDIKKTIDHIMGHVAPRPTGYCAAHVSDALEAGGLKPVRPGSAYKYADGRLENIGFEQIPTDSVPQVGDIMVYEPKGQHIHGHVQIYNGKNWVSDWVQGNGSWFNKGNVTAHMYRFGQPEIMTGMEDVELAASSNETSIVPGSSSPSQPEIPLMLSNPTESTASSITPSYDLIGSSSLKSGLGAGDERISWTDTAKEAQSSTLGSIGTLGSKLDKLIAVSTAQTNVQCDTIDTINNLAQLVASRPTNNGGGKPRVSSLE